MYSNQDRQINTTDRQIDQWNRIGSPETGAHIYDQFILNRDAKAIRISKGPR